MSFLNNSTIQSLQIERMIFHVVGSKETDYLELEEITPIQFVEFFLDRLRTIVKGHMYDFEDGSLLLTALNAITADRDAFVSRSKALANQFQMGHRGNASKGALVLFQLSSDIGRLYAVAKFDHEQVISFDVERTPSGNKVVIESLLNTLVKNNEALQKSAMIRINDAAGELIVRDKSAPPGKITAYFQQFLGARRRFTESELTQKLVNIAKEVATENAPALGPAVMQGLSWRLYDAVRNLETFDPTDDVFFSTIFGAVPADSPVRAAFRRRLEAERMEHESFEFDHSLLRRPTKHRLTTREGIQVIYNLQDATLVTRAQQPNGKTIITIETSGIVEDDDITEPRSARR